MNPEEDQAAYARCSASWSRSSSAGSGCWTGPPGPDQTSVARAKLPIVLLRLRPG